MATKLQELLAKQEKLMGEYADTVQASQDKLGELKVISEEIEAELEKESQRGTGTEDVQPAE
jgi:hypothetical protein